MRPAVFDCRARDICIGDLADRPDVFDWAECTVSLSAAREIIGIVTEPVEPRAVQMIGVVAGRQSRSAIREIFGKEEAISSLLCVLLDDLAGVSLIAPWAWFVAQTLGAEGGLATGVTDLEQRADEFGQPKHEVCLGHSNVSRRERNDNGERNYTLGQPARDLTLPGDLGALHDLRSQSGVTIRRVRWLDLHRRDGALVVDVGFQDSASAPHLTQRRTVHQYTGRFIVRNGMLTDISVSPEVLPYKACFHAPESLSLLRPVPISELNTKVPTILAKTLGCTHLNDMMRSLSAIQVLDRVLQDNGDDRNN